MKIFEDTIKIDNTFTNKYITEKDLLFDLETTGLSRKFCHIYMIGTGYIEGNFLHTMLFFAEDITEERAIINEFIKRTRPFERLITYNGNRFDIPFFKERLDSLMIDFDLDSFDSLDIYARLKKLKHLLLLPGMKQKDIEKFLGIERDDKYDGGKLIEVYKSYQIRPDDESEYLLMIHNKEDIIGMSKILSVLSYEGIKTLTINDLSKEFSSDRYTFETTTDLSIPKPIRIVSDDVYLILDSNKLKGSIQTTNGYMKKYFPNPDEYLYHLEDERIIPKVIVSKADMKKYRKVSKEECFVEIDIKDVTDNLIIENIYSCLKNSF